MKRMFIMVLLVFVCSFVFADFVENMNGEEWVSWSRDQRVAYVQGFMSAYSSVWGRMLVSFGQQADSETRDMLMDWFYFPMSVGDVVRYVNDYYSYSDNLRFKITEVIMLAGGKDYWNK